MNVPHRILSGRAGGHWVGAVLLLSLVGMEMSWFTPLILSLHRPGWGTAPGWYLLGLSGMMLALMGMAWFLSSRRLSSPRFELAVLATLVLCSLVILRLYVFRHEPWFSLSWVSLAFVSAGPQRIDALLVLVAVAYLWWRGVSYLQREINFFSIGLDFRKGVIGLAVASSLYTMLARHAAAPFIYAFFFFSLIAVALGRVEDKALTSSSRGRSPRPVWLGIVAGCSLALVAVVAVLAQWWNVEALAALQARLAPAGAWLLVGVESLLLFVLRLLEPLFAGFITFLQWLITPLFVRLRQNPPAALTALQSFFESAAAPQRTEPGWVEPLFRVVVPCLFGVLVLLALVLWLQRRRAGQVRRSELEGSAPVSGWEGQGGLGLLQRARSLARLVNRFGLGRRFYTALTVRHVYANLQHLAAERGFPRHQAQTPNDYLPMLAQAFPGHEDAVAHITTLYNAYEYGDIPTDAAEMRRLHKAWDAIRRETGTGQVARRRPAQ